MSTLRVNTLQNTSGTEIYTVKAWVNFNGTGTVAIRSSGNVSSITDLGTGLYTVNFTTAMTDVNYSVVAVASGRDTHVGRVVGAGYTGDTFSTSAVTIRTGLGGGSGSTGILEDPTYVFVNIVR